MKIVFKLLGWCIGVMLFFGVLGFVGNGMGLISYQFFGPKWADAERDVFENTNSFSKGKIQETIKYKLEYDRSTSVIEKNAIKSTIAMSLSDFDEDKFVKSNELKAFIKKMKYGSPLTVQIERAHV